MTIFYQDSNNRCWCGVHVFYSNLHCFCILIFSWPWWTGSLGSAGPARWVPRSPSGRDPQEGGCYSLAQQVALQSNICPHQTITKDTSQTHKTHSVQFLFREVGELRGLLVSLAEKEGTLEHEVCIKYLGKGKKSTKGPQILIFATCEKSRLVFESSTAMLRTI